MTTATPRPPAHPASGVWTWLFGRRNRLHCPFCLKLCSLNKGEVKCNAPGGCGRDIPPLYLEYSHTMPPLFVPVLGWTGCGKTHSIIGAADTLAKMQTIWRDYFYREADEPTMEWLRQM